MRIGLEGSAAQVWALRLDEVERAWPGCVSVLSAEETAGMRRFRSARDRVMHSVSRACLRLLLGRYREMPPEDIRFEKNGFGKLSLAGDQNAADMRFNISHSGEYVVLGFTLGRDIGVDIEAIKAIAEFGELAHDICSPEELRRLESVPVRDRLTELYRYWTLKEAYVKAIGVGLSFPHRTVRVLATEKGYALDMAGTWSVLQYDGIPGYAVAAVGEGRTRFELLRDIPG